MPAFFAGATDGDDPDLLLAVSHDCRPEVAAKLSDHHSSRLVYSPGRYLYAHGVFPQRLCLCEVDPILTLVRLTPGPLGRNRGEGVAVEGTPRRCVLAAAEDRLKIV
jgi:hypothetical protein